MRPGWIAAAAISMFSLTALAAKAEDSAAWLKDRQARFAAYHAAHPSPDAEIAQIGAKTAALVAAAGPAGEIQAAVDHAPLSWRTSDKLIELWDGADYPETIAVPAGEFSMGSKAEEFDHRAYETPRHRVRIGYSMAVGKYHVTLGEFARFVADTGYDAGNQCFTSEEGRQPRPGRNWRNPSFEQTSTHAAVCINWKDAQAYVAWLSRKTGHAYRLLSEAENEYVNRAGSTTSYWWGEDASAACAYANEADADAKVRFPQLTANTCHDGYVFTAPEGSFKPNPFGLYDTASNVWSWLEDCFNDNYKGAPTDGSPSLTGDCSQRMLRPGSWSARPVLFRSALRIRYPVDVRVDDHGFRVARTL